VNPLVDSRNRRQSAGHTGGDVILHLCFGGHSEFQPAKTARRARAVRRCSASDSQRTNGNRANQRGENPNNPHAKSLRGWKLTSFSAGSFLAAARASRTAPAAIQLLPWSRLQSSCACQSPLPAFDARRCAQVHAIWFQECFRIVSPAMGCTAGAFAAMDCLAPPKPAQDQEVLREIRKCVSFTPCCACAISIPR
jgi:hypothetical protein